jgi:hypothetical protein
MNDGTVGRSLVDLTLLSGIGHNHCRRPTSLSEVLSVHEVSCGLVRTSGVAHQTRAHVGVPYALTDFGAHSMTGRLHERLAMVAIKLYSNAPEGYR